MERSPNPKRPGIVKVRGGPLLVRRSVELAALFEGLWRRLLDGADVLSEGAAREEEGGCFYYGTSSLLVALPEGAAESAPAAAAGAREAGGGPPPSTRAVSLDELVALLGCDPHVRVRVLRLARRDAVARAGPLSSLEAEITVERAPAGAALRITVDVKARVLRASAKARR